MRLTLLLLPLAACAAPPAGEGGGTGSTDSEPSADTSDTTSPCENLTGTFREQSLDVDGVPRFYFLHVPDSYDCDVGMPLLIDFHGTVSGTDEDTAAEEAYGEEALVAEADEQGFIVLRPRSLSASWEGSTVFQWDINRGDLARNVAFARLLLADVESRYTVDPDRLYASGFSNGTNMAAQLLGETDLGVDGYGLVGGGEWNAPEVGDRGHSPFRVWATTGYRDYMWPYQRDLVDRLEGAGLAADQVFERETDNGHELYDWHWGEMWAWLDRGERPPDAEPSDGWALDTDFPSDESLTELTETADGDLLAVSARGGVFRWEGGGWETVHEPDDVAPLAAVCVQPDGRGLAAGFDRTLRTDDGGRTWTDGPSIPDFSGMWGDRKGRVNGVACADGRLTAGGYWTGATSTDGGQSWDAATMPLSGGYDAQVAALRTSADGTTIAVGYYYIGRSEDGIAFEQTWSRWNVHWFTGAAAGSAGRWWVSGEAGTVLFSDDDGRTWSAQLTGLTEDLYAIAFRDDEIGLVVGGHGAAALTRDGGSSWEDVSLGVDRFLGGVHFRDDGRAVVVGEDGTVALLDTDVVEGQ